MSIVVQLEIVTPESLLLSEDTLLVTAPGVEGYFGVMAGHAPFVTLLATGMLTVGEGDDARWYVIAGGYAEVMPEKVTILTERAVPLEQLDLQQAKKDQKEATDKLATLDQEDSQTSFWRSRLEFAKVSQELLNKFNT